MKRAVLFIYVTCHIYVYHCLSTLVVMELPGLLYEFFLSAHFKGRQTSQGVVNKANTSECSLTLWDCPSTAKFVSISKFASTVRLSLTLFNFEVRFYLQLRPSKNDDMSCQRNLFQVPISASMIVFGDIWIPDRFGPPNLKLKNHEKLHMFWIFGKGHTPVSQHRFE